MERRGPRRSAERLEGRVHGSGGQQGGREAEEGVLDEAQLHQEEGRRLQLHTAPCGVLGSSPHRAKVLRTLTGNGLAALTMNVQSLEIFALIHTRGCLWSICCMQSRSSVPDESQSTSEGAEPRTVGRPAGAVLRPQGKPALVENLSSPLG